MIPKKEKRVWHYLAVNKLLALLRGIMLKFYSDFSCLNCLHSLATKGRLELNHYM